MTQSIVSPNSPAAQPDPHPSWLLQRLVLIREINGLPTTTIEGPTGRLLLASAMDDAAAEALSTRVAELEEEIAETPARTLLGARAQLVLALEIVAESSRDARLLRLLHQVADAVDRRLVAEAEARHD